MRREFKHLSSSCGPRRASAVVSLAIAGLALCLPSTLALGQGASPGGNKTVDIRTLPPEQRPQAAPDSLPDTPAQIRGLDIEEKIGNYLPMELEFTTSEGTRVNLGDYFKNTNKPAVILLVYYDCPIVCDVLMGKVAETFRDLNGMEIGKDFNVLFFSFDPSETPATSKPLRKIYLDGYYRDKTGPIPEEIAAGWQFHTSDSENVKRLADALGFKYRRMENGEYSHPVCTFLATPEGRIARYIYGYHGLPTSGRDMRLALIEASNGDLAQSIGDRFLSFCYMYDPKAGQYTLQAMRVMQLGGVATMIGLGTLIGTLMLTDRMRRRLKGGSSTSGNSGSSSGTGGTPDATAIKAGPQVVVIASPRASSTFDHAAGNAPRSGGQAAGMAL
jgi:protein SCO1/2